MGVYADLSVVIPAYNEARRLGGTIDEIVAFLRPRADEFEVVISDDGSTDGTLGLVDSMRADVPELRIVASSRNHGKGRAVRDALATIDGRPVLVCDADGSTPITELESLAAALAAGADMAVGSRALHSASVDRTTRLHRQVLGRIFTFLAVRPLRLGFADTQCGFKLLSAKVAALAADRLTVDGFGYDLELLVIARDHSLEIAEVPVSWHEVPGSKVRLWIDPYRMLKEAWTIRRAVAAGEYR